MKIIFILLDDLGWNDVGINNPLINTPNICNLSQEACTLERNYAFSVCGPTRAMIQTGIYAYKYGMQKLLSPWNYYGLDPKLKLIPDYLKVLGYESFAIGKWHLGHNNRKWLPNKRGYKLHYGNLTGCINHVSHLNCGSNIHDFSCNTKPIHKKGHFCDILTEKAIEIIEENKDNKFFMYLAYNSPHTPHMCPAQFEEKYSGPKKTYYGMISHLDYNLGKIFSKLKDLNIFDDTIIWLQSDNGGWTINQGDNYPLRDGKTSFYDGGTKVFTILKNKNINIKKFKGFTHSVDVLPTLVDFAGGDPDEIKLDGISINKYLTNDSNPERILIIAFYSEIFWCFIINNLKFINENGKMQCYDLLADPNEKSNIISKNYENFKSKITKTIEECKKTHVLDPDLYNQSREICDVKYWGQRVKKSIMMQNCSNPDKKVHETFLSLSGYDIFYQ